MSKPRKKMGRPLISNKPLMRVNITLDEESYNILTKYCNIKGISKSELIRNYARELKDKIE